MERSIITILYPRETLHPRTRPIPSDAVQVHGDHFVDHLRLAVGLWVERCSHTEFDAHHLEEILPHVPDEHGSRSLTMDSGNLQRRTMPSKKALATIVAM